MQRTGALSAKLTLSLLRPNVCFPRIISTSRLTGYGPNLAVRAIGCVVWSPPNFPLRDIMIQARLSALRSSNHCSLGGSKRRSQTARSAPAGSRSRRLACCSLRRASALPHQDTNARTDILSRQFLRCPASTCRLQTSAGIQPRAVKGGCLKVVSQIFHVY